MSSRRDRTRRLTNDLYDDLDPSFIPNTNKIVFSSNRTTDSVTTIVKGYKMMPTRYNLFTYDLDSTDNLVHKLTNTVSKDVKPIAVDDDTFYYLTDQRGIMNLFKFTKSTGIYSQITNFNTNIAEYDVNFPEHSLAVVLAKNMSTEIFVVNQFNYDRSVFTPSTRRKEVQQQKAIIERKQHEENSNMSIKELINSRLKAKSDTVTINIPDKKPQPPVDNRSLKNDTIKSDSINTDDYQFDEPVTKPAVISEKTPAVYFTHKSSERGEESKHRRLFLRRMRL
ncbi:MAG: hypothetical protein WDO14_00370 [Bacteroidota bacterium]